MTDRGQVLRDALNVINGERQDQYGAPEDSFALIAEYWEVYIRNALLRMSQERGIELQDVLFEEFIRDDDVAFLMTLFKIARENFQHKKDNLVDAAGYLGIAGDMYEDPDIDETNEGSSEGLVLGDHSERTAADELEETLLWRQKGLANHTYTDEEPEHRMRNKPSNPVGTRSAIPNLDNPTFEKMKPYLEGYVGRELGAPTWTPKDD
jgi:hypothetical protein